MPEANLAPDERAALIKLLRETIAADSYPLSPRIRTLKAALPKLDSESMQRAIEPLPPPKPWTNSMIGGKKHWP